MDDLWRRHRSEKFNETPERKVEEGERNLRLGAGLKYQIAREESQSSTG